MALIQCSECGKEISDKARVCPNCGAPIETLSKVEHKSEENKSKKTKYIIGGIMIAFMAIMVSIIILCNLYNIFGNRLLEVEKSVVTIYCYDSNGNNTATGSGFIVYDSNTLITNYHVLELASSMSIETEDGASYAVEDIVSYSKETDIAILTIDGQTNLRPLAIKNKMPQKGDKVYAIGSPKGIQNTVSEGIVSGIREYTDEYSYIQITAPITHGSSGGALFDDKYNVIGVTSSGLEGEGDLNFAIPIQVVEDLYVAKEKEYDTIGELYKANIQESDIDHHCNLEKMNSSNTYSIGALSFVADTIGTGDTFVYGYYSSSDSKSIYLYSDKSLVSGDAEYDYEYDSINGGVLDDSTNIISIDYEGVNFHSSKQFEVGDLVVVYGFTTYAGDYEYKMPDHDYNYYYFNAREIANIEGLGLL